MNVKKGGIKVNKERKKEEEERINESMYVVVRIKIKVFFLLLCVSLFSLFYYLSFFQCLCVRNVDPP